MEAEEREEESERASYFRSGGGGGLFLTELIILSEGAGLETGGCDRRTAAAIRLLIISPGQPLPLRPRL